MPRDRRRQMTDRQFIHALQHLRLKGLETGRFQPVSDREEFYLRLYRAGRRPDREDFILSPALFRLEAILGQTGADVSPDAAPPFTPTPEPAISRA